MCVGRVVGITTRQPGLKRLSQRTASTMSTQSRARGLHLESLSIKGFRGINDLNVPKLGRVTLIVGKNGVGKTSVLDAVRLHADRGSYSTIIDILQDRDEFSIVQGEDGEETALPDFGTLFHGRQAGDSCISIGPRQVQQPQLAIKAGPGLWQDESPLAVDLTSSDDFPLKIEFDGIEQKPSRSTIRRIHGLPASRLVSTVRQSGVQCISLGPHVPTNDDIGSFWDHANRTNQENRAISALQLIYGEQIDKVTMIADKRLHGTRRLDRLAIVSIKGEEASIPLRSLGDGAVRMYSIALALTNSRNGFLVIDEVENGLHYSVQTEFWKMVLQTAEVNNVQVLATTHCWDCVVGFGHAASQMEETDGLVIRIDRLGDRMQVVEYTKKDLQVAIRQHIEVR